MHYRYKNLSMGYTGQTHKEATLNSKYYYHFFDLLNKDIGMVNHVIAFPQRIPRKGFFMELYELETEEYKNDINARIKKMAGNHKNSLEILIQNNSEKNARKYINWSNILLRYGQFENLINFFPVNYSGPYHLEIQLIKETAKIEILLSNNSPITLDELLEISDRFIDSNHVTNIEKIKLLNQIIVYFYRHHHNNDKKIFTLANQLLAYIERIEKPTFINTYLCSVAYRGLAMVTEFSEHIKSSLLEESLNYAIQITPYSNLEKIVAKDNLFTCTQSISKWHVKNNNIKDAENSLLQLIQIDPNLTAPLKCEKRE